MPLCERLNWHLKVLKLSTCNLNASDSYKESVDVTSIFEPRQEIFCHCYKFYCDSFIHFHSYYTMTVQAFCYSNKINLLTGSWEHYWKKRRDC